MLFLSAHEKTGWENLARTIIQNQAKPEEYQGMIRSNLLSAFYYFIGTRLAAQGQSKRCREWIYEGTLCEEEGLFSSTFLMGFLSRHNGMMNPPAVVFEDPRPYIHFSQVPAMEKARQKLIHQFAHSLSAFDHPIRFMDIGSGDGTLTVRILTSLINSGKVPGFSEIMLIDSSPAMITLAKEKIEASFPGVLITTVNARIQDCSGSINRRYHIAMSSLAYHHMPVEDKRLHLTRIKPLIDHFLLFEMNANHDTPDLYSPDLVLSVYQSYGRIIDFVFSHDAPADVVTDCIDSFLMTELISILTEPRGKRSDYHMLRTQWNDLFISTLGPEFTLRSDSSCYADEYLDLFLLHYGRESDIIKDQA
jgi:SAM-dependent methyltransferase